MMRLELDITVQRGSFTLDMSTVISSRACGIFGPSGSGKSTCLDLIAGLIRPQRGHVILSGQSLSDVARNIHVPPHQRRMGVVFQHGHLLPHYSVAGNLRYGESLLPASQRRIAFEEVVQLLDIGTLLPARPATLSGGERQRVAIGRALLCSPQLLLFDEPLAALDARLKRQIIAYLRIIRQRYDIPIIYVSHDLPELLQVCDELLLLERGRIAAQGSLASIAGHASLLPFLHEAGMANILTGSIASHEHYDGLTHLMLPGGARITCPLRQEAIGTSIELMLRPDDIALSRQHIQDISLQNCLPGTVLRLITAPDRVLVAIDVGQEILAEVSARTVEQLRIAPGAAVWVLFKAMSLSEYGQP